MKERFVVVRQVQDEKGQWTTVTVFGCASSAMNGLSRHARLDSPSDDSVNVYKLYRPAECTTDHLKL